jgi:hypothetical protein
MDQGAFKTLEALQTWQIAVFWWASGRAPAAKSKNSRKNSQFNCPLFGRQSIRAGSMENSRFHGLEIRRESARQDVSATLAGTPFAINKR